MLVEVSRSSFSRAGLPSFCLWLMMVQALPGHTPFGSSIQAGVYGDRVDVCVTMGASAARVLLTELPSSTQRPVPGGGAVTLGVDLAPQIILLSTNGVVVPVQRAELSTDGVDHAFTFVFSLAPGPSLDFDAVYLESIESSVPSPFVAYDESTNRLASALLSRTMTIASVVVPPALVAGQERRESNGVPAKPASGVRSEPPKAAPATVRPAGASPSFGQFLNLGVEHILMGFDHLLFLAALLIGVRKLGAMLGVITCFTLAHSMTLALAALDLVRVAPRLVEPLIAASILAVGIENLVRKDAAGDRFWMAGGFGLIHGFGFASALRETGLGISGFDLVKPLLAFNLGVEAGQLAVAAVFLPLLFLSRRWPVFARRGTPALSVVVIVVSAYWLVERAFGLG